MSHSIIAPSSASIWRTCTGYPMMAAQYPETERSEAATAGDRAHAIAAELLENGDIERVTVQEEYDAALVFVEQVRDKMALTGVTGGINLAIERKVKCPRIHELSEGTPDAWLYDANTKNLYIWDLKYGYGIVEAFENWQMINYASGILDVIGTKDDVNVHMTVVQPRAFHSNGTVRTWSILSNNLLPYHMKLATAARAAMMQPECVTGAHCRYCEARHACEALEQKVLACLEMIGQPIGSNLPPDALGLELSMLQDAAKTIEYRLAGLQTEVESKLRAGTSVPGWSMVEKFGNRKWTLEDDHMYKFCKELDVNVSDMLKPAQWLSPAQAIKKGFPRDAVEKITTRAKTMKLTENDNTKARSIFGGK